MDIIRLYVSYINLFKQSILYQSSIINRTPSPLQQLKTKLQPVHNSMSSVYVLLESRSVPQTLPHAFLKHVGSDFRQMCITQVKNYEAESGKQISILTL